MATCTAGLRSFAPLCCCSEGEAPTIKVRRSSWNAFIVVPERLFMAPRQDDMTAGRGCDVATLAGAALCPFNSWRRVDWDTRNRCSEQFPTRVHPGAPLASSEERMESSSAQTSTHAAGPLT